MNGSFRLGNDGIYRCDALQEFPWQEHGFGTRLANPWASVMLRQIHSDRVVNAANVCEQREEMPEGDALISDVKGLSIGVRTADCVPILMLDGKQRVVAAVHAGWRGSAAELTRRTLHQLSETFGTDPAEVYAAIGPCIRACCYEVGSEVARQFAAQFPEWDQEEIAHRKLDLPEANRRQLAQCSVQEDRIFDSGLCTVCRPEEFFSFRRDPQETGRMISAITCLT